MEDLFNDGRNLLSNVNAINLSCILIYLAYSIRSYSKISCTTHLKYNVVHI